jgi:hypothetical protein
LLTRAIYSSFVRCFFSIRCHYRFLPVSLCNLMMPTEILWGMHIYSPVILLSAHFPTVLSFETSDHWARVLNIRISTKLYRLKEMNENIFEKNLNNKWLNSLVIEKRQYTLPDTIGCFSDRYHSSIGIYNCEYAILPYFSFILSISATDQEEHWYSSYALLLLLLVRPW